MLEIAEFFHQKAGKVLLVDEIHYQQNFADYLNNGAYPFFMEGEAVFVLKLTEAIRESFFTAMLAKHRLKYANRVIT